MKHSKFSALQGNSPIKRRRLFRGELLQGSFGWVTPALGWLTHALIFASLLFLSGCGPRTSSVRKQKAEQTPEAPLSSENKSASTSNAIDGRSSRSSADEAKTREGKDARAKDTDQLKPAAAKSSINPLNESSPALDEAGVTYTHAADGSISSVDFGQIVVDDKLISAVAELKGPSRLAIHNTSLTADAWQQVAQMSTLRHLDLRGCSINNANFQAVLAGLPELVSLRLNGQNGATTVDDEGMTALANCPGLRVLAVDHLWVGEQGLQQVAKLKQLNELYLAATVVDDEATSLLSQLPKLRKLRLALTSVTAEGLMPLAELPLVELDLSECSQVGDDAMQVVGKMTSLVKLNLFKTTVSDAGVAELDRLQNLEWLNLDQTLITDAAMPTVGELSSLTFLHLGSTAVSDAGMPDLVSLRALRQLIATRTGVTQAGVVMLKNWLSGVEIQLKYVAGQ